jgi:hypothetical protein
MHGRGKPERGTFVIFLRGAPNIGLRSVILNLQQKENDEFKREKWCEDQRMKSRQKKVDFDML